MKILTESLKSDITKNGEEFKTHVIELDKMNDYNALQIIQNILKKGNYNIETIGL